MKDPNLHVAALKAALARYQERWTAACEETESLEVTFENLRSSLSDLAGLGSHISQVFPNEMAQEWWVAFCEKNGDMIPRHPTEAPPMMEKVDERPVETAS